jgi:dTMP kinase
MRSKGYFIVFEGIDGGGKSSQIKLLKDYLKQKGFKIELHIEPTKSPIGELLWKYMKFKDRNLVPETEALLFAADRVEHSRNIKKALDEKKIVICDRYTHSSLAYQGATGVDFNWMRSLNKYALKPDLIILLDIDPHKGLERVSNRKKTIFEDYEYLKKVRTEYLRFAEKGELVVIDAAQSINDVHKEIISRIEYLLKGN